MKQNRSLKSALVPVAPRSVLDHLNLAVEPLGPGIGDRNFQVGKDVCEMPFDRFGGFSDCGYLRACCPSMPRGKERTRTGFTAISPKFRKLFFDGPSAPKLRVLISQGG